MVWEKCKLWLLTKSLSAVGYDEEQILRVYRGNGHEEKENFKQLWRNWVLYREEGVGIDILIQCQRTFIKEYGLEELIIIKRQAELDAAKIMMSKEPCWEDTSPRQKITRWKPLGISRDTPSTVRRRRFRRYERALRRSSVA